MTRRANAHIASALTQPGFTLVEADIRDQTALAQMFEQYRPARVAHLAAMAGPRPSLQRPELYEEVNIRGTLNILDASRRFECKGWCSLQRRRCTAPRPHRGSKRWPPIVRYAYAATKRAAEMLAYTYHNQYGIPTRVVRFFTVYGRRGRPDMTPYLFVDAMRQHKPITLFNGGKDVYRDWTHYSDMSRASSPRWTPIIRSKFSILAILAQCNSLNFIAMLEEITGLNAIIEARPLPAADRRSPLRTLINRGRCSDFSRNGASRRIERFLGMVSETRL